MALIFADLVQETTATTGTGTLSLAGAAAQSQSFITGIGNGNTCYYTLLSGNGTDWEIGIGTVASGSPNTLARTTILKSSNSGSAISLSGTSAVICSMPAEYMVNAQFSRYVAKTTTYTAVAGDQILADTSSAAWTLTLPASPAVNDTIEIVDAMQCFDAKNLTISPNGLKIQGVLNSLVLDEACANATLTYSGTTYGWVVSMSRGASTATKWNINDHDTTAQGLLFPVAPNSRRCHALGVTSSTGNASLRANTSRSSGKLYFELKKELSATVGPVFGVAPMTASMNLQAGADANGYAYVLGNGQVYHNNSVTTTVATCAAGDVVGMAVDFTASTGSIKIYKNNSLLYTYSSLTLGTLGIMITHYSGDILLRALLSTTAQQCTYSPPSGYSYWDN
jgi:hypothetical protein